jgi:hypothetical protein
MKQVQESIGLLAAKEKIVLDRHRRPKAVHHPQ